MSPATVRSGYTDGTVVVIKGLSGKADQHLNHTAAIVDDREPGGKYVVRVPSVANRRLVLPMCNIIIADARTTAATNTIDLRIKMDAERADARAFTSTQSSIVQETVMQAVEEQVGKQHTITVAQAETNTQLAEGIAEMRTHASFFLGRPGGEAVDDGTTLSDITDFLAGLGARTTKVEGYVATLQVNGAAADKAIENIGVDAAGFRKEVGQELLGQWRTNHATAKKLAFLERREERTMEHLSGFAAEYLEGMFANGFMDRAIASNQCAASPMPVPEPEPEPAPAPALAPKPLPRRSSRRAQP
jgi:hypothetical protein